MRTKKALNREPALLSLRPKHKHVFIQACIIHQRTNTHTTPGSAPSSQCHHLARHHMCVIEPLRHVLLHVRYYIIKRRRCRRRCRRSYQMIQCESARRHTHTRSPVYDATDPASSPLPPKLDRTNCANTMCVGVRVRLQTQIPCSIPELVSHERERNFPINRLIPLCVRVSVFAFAVAS